MLAHHGQTINLTSGFVFDFNFLNPTTLCVHRVDKGGVPACAEAVSGEGVIFGDLYDADSKINLGLKIQITNVHV
jgi:molybdopterin-containing oxidoreductase family iron-sulfur binding subunit